MRRAVRLGALAAIAAGPACAQVDPGWVLTGTQSARAERYDTSGDRAFSPYALKSGDMAFGDFSITGRRQDSPWRFWRFLVAGTVNGSPYRSLDDGVVPERMAIAREDGEAAIPWRAEAGDFFAFTSLRTQQRPLKGVALEFQPALATPALRQSLSVFAGTAQSSWRHLQWSDENTVGASWLLEAGSSGRLGATALSSERRASADPDAAALRQFVASLAGETTRGLGPWKVRVEGEAATFRGDHGGAGTPPVLDRRDTGLFGQVSGFDARWNWRLRGERYGADYRPFGAAVTADRRSAEAHLAYAFAGGLAVRGRLQDYRDQAESANPLDTRVAGLQLSGPLGSSGTSVMVDAFTQDQSRRDGSLDARFTNATATASRAFAGGWTGQLLLLDQRTDNRIDDALDARTSQVQASAILPLRFGEFAGSVTPGLTWRHVRGAGATRDWQPSIALALSGGPHRLSLSAGRVAQRARATTTADLATVNASFDYRYRTGPHEFGIDGVLFDRDPATGEGTRAWRIGLAWTVALDGALAAATRAPATPLAVAPLTAAGVTPSADLLVRLAPDAELEASLAALSSGGLGTGGRQPGAIVFETRLLPEIEQRQRLVVAHEAGRITRSALVVSLGDAGALDDAARLYERTRRALLDRFGNPSFTFDEGAFGPRLAADLAAGRFIRITEWSTQAGTTLRLGIPRRLDGEARIEIHHARRFGGPRDTAWGLESVR